VALSQPGTTGSGEFAARYGPWAVIAGASEGIGAGFARQLAARGLNVVLVSRREPLLAALAEEIRESFGVDTRVAAIDLSESDAHHALTDATAGLEVGLLAYNAGANDHHELFLDVPPDWWAAMVARNCVTPLRACHHYGSAMVERGRGGILLVTSGAAWAGGARLATYGATKAFDLLFGESLWAELGPHGVDVLSLVVGATDTPALRRLMEQHGGVLEGLADSEDVAREGLEHLGDGPTWSVGVEDGGGPSFVATMPRRDAVQMISAATAQLFGATSA
jgi:short-subunit dehydrogenase